jgi:hypothetical protein
MKIAFMTYHLKISGVTTVLRQQLEVIPNDWQKLVLTGVAPEASFSADYIQIPELAYSSTYKWSFDSDNVADSIVNAIHSKFNGPCDVLHVHNPTIAKNKGYLRILKALQKRRVNLLLQVHDFAEEGRPDLYFSEDYVEDSHYAVINSRDYDILIKAGLTHEGLHCLPNTVSQYPANDSLVTAEPMVLYPVRAIRRKNIGETLLLSLFFRPDESLAITRPPDSPPDFISYNGWKEFLSSLNLRVEFEKGGPEDVFEKLARSAKYHITTSVVEGFGFSYLEPWLYDNLIWGRKLKEICRDFEKNGIRLDHLYSKLSIPVEWLGYSNLYEQWRTCISRICAIVRYPVDEKRIKESFECSTADGMIDFGQLDEFFQKQIILRILYHKRDSDKLKEINPFLDRPGEVANPTKLIQNNRRQILANYNQSLYCERLLRIYRAVSQRNVKHKIDKKVIFNSFLNLNEFSLLKWNDYRD